MKFFSFSVRLIDYLLIGGREGMVKFSAASAIAVCVSPNPPTGGGGTIPQLAEEALLRGLIPRSLLRNSGPGLALGFIPLIVEFDSQGQVKGYLNINLHGSYG